MMTGTDGNRTLGIIRRLSLSVQIVILRAIGWKELRAIVAYMYRVGGVAAQDLRFTS